MAVPTVVMAFCTNSWRSLCKVSIWSLLNGLDSIGVAASMITEFSLLSWIVRGFQSVGLPCIFLQVSLVCLVLWQWSHHGQLPLLCCPEFCCWFRATRAEPLAFGELLDVPSVNFLLLSSLWTSENTSLMLDSGLMLNIRPRTSSNSLLRPNKN